MINFINEFAKFIDLPFEEVLSDYKYLNVGGKLVCVQNYTKIISYSTEKIVLKVKRSILNIEGENLTIKELEKNNLIVSGKISNIYTA